MATVININKARKQKTRADAEKLAAENRVKFGRSKAQKQREALETEVAKNKLDQLRRDHTPD